MAPHGFGLAWDPGLIGLLAGADLAAGMACVGVLIALMRIGRQPPFRSARWTLRLVGLFMLACSATWLLDAAIVRFPTYWIDVAVRTLTAGLAVAAAVLLWRLPAGSTPAQAWGPGRRLPQDAAEREAERARLRAHATRLRSVYARTPAPLHAVDIDGNLIEVSDHWLELLGYQRDSVIGQPLARYYAPDTAGSAQLDWAALLRNANLRDREQAMLHQDGSVRTVLASATLESDPAGTPWLAVYALTDITGRKQAEAALKASEAHLQQAQKMDTVGQLTGGIAHDFSNMLTAVTCVMELLQKRLPEGDGSRPLVSSVLEAAGRAARLTGQLLAFSRRQRLLAEALDPIEVARGMGGLLTRPLGDEVRLDIREPPVPVICLADRDQLESALLNLVLNARAAIDGAGTVTIEAGLVAAGDPALAVAMAPGEEPLEHRDYVSITVGDSGQGMTAEIAAQAFEPFFTTKPVGQGRGLGLSQTYGFTRQSGGTTRIESTLGAGARITMLLPRAAGAKAVPGDRTPSPIRVANGETVLLVEDEDMLRDVVVSALQEYGFRVVPARNADEALAVFERGMNIDLLFTDILMPGSRNGVELAMELRRRHPDLPVLFATGATDRRVLERWPGRLDVLLKPYSLDMVVRAIEAAHCPPPPSEKDG